MIVVTRRGESSHVELVATRPVVYLDHCGLRRLGRLDQERQRFLAALETRNGTLAFSFVNLAELAGHEPGPSLEQIMEVLRGVGTRFVFIRSNPGLDAESYFKLPPVNTIADRDLAASCLRVGMTGPMRLDDCVAGLLAHGEAFRTTFEGLRRDTGSRVAALIAWLRASSLEPLAPAGRFSGEVCMQHLFAVALSSGVHFEENDLADLLHASVPISGCDLVVLDGRWAEFARQVPSPLRTAAVFSIKDAGFSDFLAALESWAPPPEVK